MVALLRVESLLCFQTFCKSRVKQTSAPTNVTCCNNAVYTNWKLHIKSVKFRAQFQTECSQYFGTRRPGKCVSDVASFSSRLTHLSRIFIENGTGSASNAKTLTLCQKGAVKPSIGKIMNIVSSIHTEGNSYIQELCEGSHWTGGGYTTPPGRMRHKMPSRVCELRLVYRLMWRATSLI